MDSEMSIDPRLGGRCDIHDIVTWASRRYGLITRAKLERLGFSSKRVEGLVSEGWLTRRAQGVYVAGHLAAVPGQREAISLAASGSAAALGAASAAGWLTMTRPWHGRVELAVPPGRRRPLKGAKRAILALEPEDVVVHRGLRCTSVARTLIDLARLHPDRLDQACVEALRREVDLAAVLERATGRRGAPALRAEVHRLVPELARTLSELEVAFVRLLLRHGLPVPDVNRPQPDLLILDCTWPGSDLVVELDGRAWHADRFEQDRERDNANVLRQLRTLRFTWEAVTLRGPRTAEQVAQALGLR